MRQIKLCKNSLDQAILLDIIAKAQAGRFACHSTVLDKESDKVLRLLGIRFTTPTARRLVRVYFGHIYLKCLKFARFNKIYVDSTIREPRGVSISSFSKFYFFGVALRFCITDIYIITLLSSN